MWEASATHGNAELYVRERARELKLWLCPDFAPATTDS